MGGEDNQYLLLSGVRLYFVQEMAGPGVRAGVGDGEQLNTGCVAITKCPPGPSCWAAGHAVALGEAFWPEEVTETRACGGFTDGAKGLGPPCGSRGAEGRAVAATPARPGPGRGVGCLVRRLGLRACGGRERRCPHFGVLLACLEKGLPRAVTARPFPGT